MSQLKTSFIQNSAVIDTKISNLAVIGSHLAASAKQAVLESKIFAVRDVITNIDVIGPVGSIDLTVSQINGVAKNDNTRTTDTTGAAKGVYVGTVSGPADQFKVYIRISGSDNGIPDGLGDEIYGVLTYDSGNTKYVLSFKDSLGAPATVSTSYFMDIFFVEFVDLYQVNPADLLLLGGISGVVDATSANTLSSSITAISTLLSTEVSNLESDVALLQSVDSAVSTLLSTEVSNLESDVALLQSVDSAISTLLSTEVSNLESDVALLQSVDSAISTMLSTEVSSLYSSIASDISRLDASDTAIATATQALIAAEADARVAGDSAISTLLSTEVSNLESDVALLQSVDSAISTMLSTEVSSLESTIAGLSGAPNSERVALTSSMVALKYVELSDIANASNLEASSLFVKSGLPQMYPDDYVFSELTSPNDCISWSGLGLDGVLAISDIIRISYYK